MPDDFGLEALATIQAEESRAYREGRDFRDAHLDGEVFADTQTAEGWVREQLHVTTDNVRDFRPTAPRNLDMDNELAVRRARYVWVAQRNDAGHSDIEYPTDSEAMLDLGRLVFLLSLRYSWPLNGTLWFVLCDTVPRLDPVTHSATKRYAIDLRDGSGKPDTLGLRSYVAGPFSEEIVLYCRPQATTGDVVAKYQEAQRRLLEGSYIAPRERIRPMKSARVRDLAVLGGRIALGAFSDWGTAWRAYAAKHPDDTTYADQPRQDAGLFRRDVKAAYRKATGCILDFKPMKKGGPATVTREMDTEGFDCRVGAPDTLGYYSLVDRPETNGGLNGKP